MSYDKVEQQINNCKSIVDDIKLLVNNNAATIDFLSLVTLYEHKFNQLLTSYKNNNDTLPSVNEDISNAELSPLLTSYTNSSVTSAHFVDDDFTEFDISFGMYDGQWILGIDSTQAESISICVTSLTLIIQLLEQISAATKK